MSSVTSRGLLLHKVPSKIYCEGLLAEGEKLPQSPVLLNSLQGERTQLTFPESVLCAWYVLSLALIIPLLW